MRLRVETKYRQDKDSSALRFLGVAVLPAYHRRSTRLGQLLNSAEENTNGKRTLTRRDGCARIVHRRRRRSPPTHCRSSSDVSSRFVFSVNFLRALPVAGGGAMPAAAGPSPPPSPPPALGCTPPRPSPPGTAGRATAAAGRGSAGGGETLGERGGYSR